MFRKLLAIVPILTVLNVNPAFADPRYDWSIEAAKVQLVEASSMPNRITIVIKDAKNINGPFYCSDKALVWYGKGSTDSDKKENVKAALATLLTAVSGNKTVRLYGYNNGCTVEFMHLFND